MTPRLTVIGVDTGCTGLRDADHLARELAPPGTVFACTHLIRDGRPHIALSFAVPAGAAVGHAWRHLAEQGAGAALGDRRSGPAELSAGAVQAAAEHTARSAGRAVVFPGSPALTGTLAVAALSAASAIDEVTALGAAGPLDAGQQIVTRDHVRPEWRAGRLVLTVMPAAGGTLIPFEVPNPTPCCADHGHDD
ncbi:hypothetical protein ACFYWY_36725 [Streptomyces sp. NPDC002870]|uniref:hypothetical protein n=1 Tax=Streptomyces sp. NPDC002870 TaxID=3364666 RepID=UPI0036B6B4BB